MAEGGGDHRPPIPEGKRIGRRGFVQGLAATGAVSGIGAVGANEVLRASERGFVTEAAVFDPHYELHNFDTLGPDTVPHNTDVFFREFRHREGNFACTPEQILHAATARRGIVPFQPEGDRIFPEELLAKFAEEGTSVMIGDINFPDHLASTAAAEFLAALPVGVSSTISLVDHYRKKRIFQPSQKDIDRRRILKMGAGLGAWAASPLVAPLGAGLAAKSEIQVLENIANRLNAVQSKLHPEHVAALFRDALWASKLHAVAEAEGQEKGDKPKISYVVGTTHTGVEDFLRFPKLARNTVLAYPRQLLRHIVDLNGGVEEFSSARLLKLPAPGEDTRGDSGGSVRDSIVTDMKLQSMVEAKLRFDATQA